MAHELTDWYEEAERLRVERDALTARLVERDAEIAAEKREKLAWMSNPARACAEVAALRVVVDLAMVWRAVQRATPFPAIATQELGDLMRALDALSAVPAPPTADTMPNPWRAELDARIERYVAAFSVNPSTLTTEQEYHEWHRTRMRLEADAKAALTDYAMREAKNRNGIVSDTPAPPTAAPLAEAEPKESARMPSETARILDHIDRIWVAVNNEMVGKSFERIRRNLSPAELKVLRDEIVALRAARGEG
jgi:hypothetical protein